MKMKKKILCGILPLLAAAIVVTEAGAQQRTVELTLDQALEIALDENPTVKVADLEIERQRHVKNETWGNFLPTVSAEGTYSHAMKKAGGMQGLMSADDIYSVGGSASLPLLVPALFQTLKLNDEQMRVAVEAARASKINLVNEVKKAYYQILLAEQSLEVLRMSEASITRTVDDTRTKLENELASEYDLITAEVQLSNLRPTIFEAENGIRTAKKMINMLLDMPDDVTINVAGTLNDMALMTPAVYSRDISDNSDLRSLGIQGDILSRTLKLQRSSRMPSLVAFGSATSTGMEEVDFQKYMTTGQMATNFKWNTPISVGVRLSVPLFSGFTNVQKERQTRNAIKQLDYQKYYLEKGLAVQVENAINTISTAREKMLANRRTIDQAQKGYDISKVRYDGGMGTILELNSAELALTQARLNYTQAIFDYLSAEADYEKITGKE